MDDAKTNLQEAALAPLQVGLPFPASVPSLNPFWVVLGAGGHVRGKAPNKTPLNLPSPPTQD